MDLSVYFGMEGLLSVGRELAANVLHSGIQILTDQISFTAQTGEYKGGVASTVAAYLQTKGLIDQSAILANFRPQLEMIAAMFFLFSLALAIGSVAVFGSYREGIYFLIGPPLFFFMISETIPTNGTEMRFGKYTAPLAREDEGEMLKFIRAIDGGTDAKVSRFFGMFDSLTTEAVHAVVGLLVDTENKDQLRFVGRERALHFVLGSSPDHPGFIKLIGAVHSGECAQHAPAQHRAYATQQQGPTQYYEKESALTAEKIYKDVWDKPGAPLDQETKAFLLSMKNGLTYDVGGTQQTVKVPGFENIPIDDIEDQYNPSCKDIWGFIAAACKFMAERRMDTKTMTEFYRNGTSDYPMDRIKQDIEEFLAYRRIGEQTPAQKARDVVGAFIFKNAQERTSVSALTSQAFGRAPINTNDYDDIYGTMAKSEGHGGFFRLKYFAFSIPYIQGFLIYLLSIAFPFFAIFLVVPSRASSFFAWCGMWVWVKSWDVGFAMVHVARDILWHLMKGKINIHNKELNWDDPTSVMGVIYNNDPFFSENTYWMITSILTCSIPFITAHLCLGATGMFDMFSGTIDQTAEKFGQNERARSRRFVANVNEHIQRVSHFQHARAVGMAALEYSRGKGAESFIKGQGPNGGDGAAPTPATSSGTPLIGSQFSGVDNEAQANFAQLQFNQAWMNSQMATRGFLDRQISGRKAAEARGEANHLRGSMPMEGRVPQKYLEMMYGNREIAQRFAGKHTWADATLNESRFQLRQQSIVGEITGRRMFSPIRTATNPNNINSYLINHQKQDSFMRSPVAASATAQLPGVGTALSNTNFTGFNLDQVGRPAAKRQ